MAQTSVVYPSTAQYLRKTDEIPAHSPLLGMALFILMLFRIIRDHKTWRTALPLHRTESTECPHSRQSDRQSSSRWHRDWSWLFSLAVYLVPVASRGRKKQVTTQVTCAQKLSQDAVISELSIKSKSNHHMTSWNTLVFIAAATETMTEVVNCSPPTLWFKGYFQGAVELSSSALYWSNWYKITVWQHTLCDSNKGNNSFNKKPREKKSIHFYQFSQRHQLMLNTMSPSW